MRRRLAEGPASRLLGNLGMRVLAWMAMVATAAGCGGSANSDLGNSARGFETTVAVDTPSVIAVLVIDDRATPEAAALRAGVGPAVRQLASNLIALGAAADRATWSPVDLRIVLAPASATSSDAVVSPVSDPALAWTTVEATQDGVDALATAVASHVSSLTAAEGAAFRPLTQAQSIFALLTARRAPASAAEASLLATISQHAQSTIGVSVVASSDDEDTAAPGSFWGDAPADSSVVAGLVTSTTAGSTSESFPRLHAWADARIGALVAGCGAAASAPFSLFPALCVDVAADCNAPPVALTSPGIGACAVQVETFAPDTCAPNRGWLDPADADGVRRPQMAGDGARVCDVAPVAPASMDACIHDPDCAGCGSGWCITEIFQNSSVCAPGSMPSPIRWTGGALPVRGRVHVVCREPNVR